MSGSHSDGHGDGLHVPGHTVVHHVPAHAALLGVVAFVLVVVATPATEPLAYAGYALLLGAAVVLAGLAPALVLKRMVVEVPFVVFALLVPFVAAGPRVEVLGVAVSQPGLVDAGALLAKATLGVVAAIVLSATQHPRALLRGLSRLRVPDLVVTIAGFMFRYTQVVLDEMRRMRVAREARGFEATSVRQAKVLAQSAGALFIRSYERGERVHLAMLSRGWDGAMPALTDLRRETVRRGAWLPAAVLPLAALAVLTVQLTTSRGLAP